VSGYLWWWTHATIIYSTHKYLGTYIHKYVISDRPHLDLDFGQHWSSKFTPLRKARGFCHHHNTTSIGDHLSWPIESDHHWVL
jgi:hypothetical protein